MKNFYLTSFLSLSLSASAQQLTPLISCHQNGGFRGYCISKLVVLKNDKDELKFAATQKEHAHGACQPGPFNYQKDGNLVQKSIGSYEGDGVTFAVFTNGAVVLSDIDEEFSIEFTKSECKINN
jgi:hypothetical protein